MDVRPEASRVPTMTSANGRRPVRLICTKQGLYASSAGSWPNWDIAAAWP